MMTKRMVFLLLLFMLVLAGCASGTSEAIPAATVTRDLVMYATQTPSPLPEREEPPTPTAQPSPTPTPRTHTVAQGEDLGGIAFLYGTTVPALLAANPGIDPYVMSVGTVLIIPNAAEDEALAANPVATPVPVDVGVPDCWLVEDGGAWCFALVRNSLETGVESVSVSLHMAAAEGIPEATWKTAPLLNVIPAGASLPAGAYFSPPVPASPAVSARLLVALPAADVEERYLPVVLNEETVEISGDGRTAIVSGTLSLDREDPVEATVWVAMTAKNAAGQVVGWRRWEGQMQLGGGESAAFRSEIYAVGENKIASVETLAEARP